MTPNAQHKRAERERRVARGDKRVEIWLEKDQLEWLDMDGMTPQQSVMFALYRLRAIHPKLTKGSAPS